ncbi:hypothetical protein M0R45_027141 [Rubus argutus]|uniref:Uncharacterized protein n=1 Tax=Rubus argutus TaxID=59490 RepID=A0AAW1WZZ6_RUBAR
MVSHDCLVEGYGCDGRAGDPPSSAGNLTTSMYRDRQVPCGFRALAWIYERQPFRHDLAVEMLLFKPVWRGWPLEDESFALIWMNEVEIWWGWWLHCHSWWFTKTC